MGRGRRVWVWLKTEGDSGSGPGARNVAVAGSGRRPDCE